MTYTTLTQVSAERVWTAGTRRIRHPRFFLLKEAFVWNPCWRARGPADLSEQGRAGRSPEPCLGARPCYIWGNPSERGSGQSLPMTGCPCGLTNSGLCLEGRPGVWVRFQRALGYSTPITPRSLQLGSPSPRPQQPHAADLSIPTWQIRTVHVESHDFAKITITSLGAQ